MVVIQFVVDFKFETILTSSDAINREELESDRVLDSLRILMSLCAQNVYMNYVVMFTNPSDG